MTVTCPPPPGREADALSLASHPSFAIVEAATRADEPVRAAAALERLSAWATARGTEWALGMAARSRALPSAAPETEAH
jgi:hypothetical protein